MNISGVAQVAARGLFDGSWKNAYLYDFWKHGQTAAIEKENGVGPNELYDGIKLLNRNIQVRKS